MMPGRIQSSDSSSFSPPRSSTPPELDRLRSPSSPAAPSQKRRNCSSIGRRGCSSSSALAKWVIRVMLRTAGIARRRS
jgi:hypothetical protein